MKKIIDGKLYDTETALKIACYCSEDSPASPTYLRETLYRKKTGEFFLHGKGGSESKYAKLKGGKQWCGAEAIIPLTYESAQSWAEEKLDAIKYEELFGQIAESDAKKIVTLYLRENILAQAKRVAQKKNMPISAFVEMVMNDFLNEKTARNPLSLDMGPRAAPGITELKRKD